MDERAGGVGRGRGGLEDFEDEGGCGYGYVLWGEMGLVGVSGGRGEGGRRA